MRQKIEQILYRYGVIKTGLCADEILSLLAENTGRVSDDAAPSSVSHDVRKRDASDQSDNMIESSVDGSLGNRIDDRKICFDTVENLPVEEFNRIQHNVCSCVGHECQKKSGVIIAKHSVS